VTLNQASAQSDPATAEPIKFTVTFSESVTGFESIDVTLRAVPGATAAVTGSGASYTVAVSGMTDAGTVTASIAAAIVTDAAGNNNTASTSSDNSVTDNPPASVKITGSPTATEGGATGSYTLGVSRSPTSGSVTVGITPDSQCTVAPTSVTLSDLTASTIIVTAVNDSTPEGAHNCVTQHAITASDDSTNFPTTLAVANATAAITDNDPGVMINQSGGNTAVTEGGATDTYRVVLATEPGSDVTVSISPNAQVTVDKASLTFTTGDWNTAQTVTVTAVNDTTVEGSHSGTVSHTIETGNGDGGNYPEGMSISNVSVSITDNDNPPPPPSSPTYYPEIQLLNSTTDIADNSGKLDFGKTTVNKPVVKTLTLKNTGQTTLTLGTPTLPAGFSVKNFPTSVAIGASAEFTLTLGASSAGNYSGKFSVSNNDRDENPFDFTLQGIVETPPVIIATATLTVSVSGTGSGTLGGTASGTYAAGTRVNVTATAQAGSSFVGWTPASCGTGFSLMANTQCVAQFSLDAVTPPTTPPTTPASYRLSVALDGAGEGVLGGTAAGTYATGTAVALTATAKTGSAFSGWTPASCGATFSLTADTLCTARVDLLPTQTPTSHLRLLNETAQAIESGEEIRLWVERFGDRQGTVWATFEIEPSSTAVAGVDYQLLNHPQMRWGHGVLAQHGWYLRILDNVQADGDKQLVLKLRVLEGAASIVGSDTLSLTLLDDEDPARSVLRLQGATEFSVQETDGESRLLVTREGNRNGELKARFSLLPDSTAVEGQDFRFLNNPELTWQNTLLATQGLIIEWLDDGKPEADKVLKLQLEVTQGAALIGGRNQVTLKLHDTDQCQSSIRLLSNGMKADTTCINNRLLQEGKAQNGTPLFLQGDSASLSTYIQPATQLSPAADLLVVAISGNQAWIQNGQHWQIWDGAFPAQSHYDSLPAEITAQVELDELLQQPGHYSLLTGLLLADGSLVYSPAAARSFNVAACRKGLHKNLSKNEIRTAAVNTCLGLQTENDSFRATLRTGNYRTQAADLLIAAFSADLTQVWLHDGTTWQVWSDRLFSYAQYDQLPAVVRFAVNLAGLPSGQGYVLMTGWQLLDSGDLVFNDAPALEVMR